MELFTESEQIIIILNVYEKLWNMVIVIDVVRINTKLIDMSIELHVASKGDINMSHILWVKCIHMSWP